MASAKVPTANVVGKREEIRYERKEREMGFVGNMGLNFFNI